MKTNHNNAVSELVTAPTREQSVLGWAIHCDLIDSRDIKEEFAQSILANLREFSALAYAAGRKDEREACAKVCEDFADRLSAFDFSRQSSASWCADLIRKRGEDESIS